MRKSQNYNHPKKGSSIKVEPIRERAAIKRIKKLLAGEPRNLAIFTLGISTAFRPNELVALQVRAVARLTPGDVLQLKQKRTKNIRRVVICKTSYGAIQSWLAVRPVSTSRALFPSHRADQLGVPALHLLVKTWCKNAGLQGNYGSHTLRKTWGYMERKAGVSETRISETYGHSSIRRTRTYLGV